MILPSPQLSPGSNRLTLLGIVLLLGFSAGYNYLPKMVADASLIATAVLLILNFVVAIVRKRILINKPALMVFHLALILVFVQLIISQLTYLKATTEVGVNQDFSGQLDNIRAGPLHDYGLVSGAFTNLGFQINYLDGIRRDNTLNRVRINTADGRSGPVITIGDHIPLVLGHYRFYTSHNKGYAPIFSWIPSQDNRQVLRGSVHLPAYPLNEYQQSREWQLPPVGEPIWTMLVIEEEVVPEDRDFSFTIPLKHHLIVRIGDQRWTLTPGEGIDLAEGSLRYDYLSSWMGYTVDYDWTRPWLLFTSLLGITALFVHYLGGVISGRSLPVSGK